MGTPRGDNGGVPDLPAEWGHVVIPDDPSALDEEAAEVRRHFRRQARRRRIRRALGLRPEPVRRMPTDDGGLRAPILIMSISIVITLISLIAIGLPRQQRQSTTQRPPNPDGAPILAITLSDMESHPIRIRDTLPAVILLVDECACEALVAATLVATEPGVHVVEITSRPPTTPVPAAPPTVAGNRIGELVLLVDRGGAARAALPWLAGTANPSAVLVDRWGSIVRVSRTVDSPADFAADLPRIAR